MNRYAYLIKELVFLRGRSQATLVSICRSVFAAVLLIGIATSYSQAIRAPMKTVGADGVVQLSGDIPSKLEGLVFPHPNALIPREKIKAILARQQRERIRPLTDLTPGMLVADRYKILTESGRGGRGVVFEVLHAGLGLTMARKAMRSEGPAAAQRAAPDSGRQLSPRTSRRAPASPTKGRRCGTPCTPGALRVKFSPRTPSARGAALCRAPASSYTTLAATPSIFGDCTNSPRISDAHFCSVSSS